MVVSYSQADSLAVAIQKTFDGAHPCKLCKVVKAGRKAEQEKPATLKVDKKSELFLVAQTLAVYPPILLREHSRFSPDGPTRNQPPLLRPPIFA